MTLAIAFWVTMMIWFFGGCWVAYNRSPWAPFLIFPFVACLLLGIKAFGI